MPAQSRLCQDPGQESFHPADREFNKSVASLRAPVEQANAELRPWRILHTDYWRP
ncbi:MAG: transposase family protein [Propionibacteriaceae bacterium]|nr:transposase family protein [Propionibacteriaceae bacterium]